MQRPLFHASRRALSGTLSVGANPTPFSVSAQAKGLGFIDQELDRARPPAAPSRQLCFYAFDSLEMACIYAEAEDTTVAWTFHEVTMPAPARVPFVLSGRLRALGQGHGHTQALAREYWNPTQAWEVCDYLSPTMSVVRVVPSPIPRPPPFCPILLQRFAHQRDADLARRLFP
ncbi:MAG: hypothetical protein HYV07_16750 [Deltaproteobacteria bacterium]|nr:hypothetical protein [Deltaproteobacteria bacterium]